MTDLDYELKEYQEILFSKKEGQAGREYLKKRNILPSTAKVWGLGFCPINYIPLIYRKKQSKYQYKMLWDRLIIPVYNVHGKLISIGGRLIYKSKNTKYANYQFTNSRNLFGIYLNYQEIRKQNIAIITEGQLDVISAWQKGIKTVTCSFGAHSGIEQIALLSRYTDNIYVIYDSDAAGSKGLNALKKIKSGDINLKLLSNLFPAGQDLDNWLQYHSKEEFYNLLNNNTISLQQRLLNQLSINCY